MVRILFEFLVLIVIGLVWVMVTGGAMDAGDGMDVGARVVTVVEGSPVVRFPAASSACTDSSVTLSGKSPVTVADVVSPDTVARVDAPRCTR